MFNAILAATVFAQPASPTPGATQVQVISQSLIDKMANRWIEPVSIISVMAILSLALFIMCIVLMQLYIRSVKEKEILILKLKTDADDRAREYQQSFASLLEKNTAILAELKTALMFLSQKEGRA